MDDLKDSKGLALNYSADCISYRHVVVHAVCQGDGTRCSWLVWLPRLRSSDGRGRRSRTDSRSHDALVVLQLISIPAYMLPRIEATISSGQFASTFSAEFARAAKDPSYFTIPDSKVLLWYLYEANETSGPEGEGGGGGGKAKFVEDAVLAGLAIAIVFVLLTLGMSAAAGVRRDADTQKEAMEARMLALNLEIGQLRDDDLFAAASVEDDSHARPAVEAHISGHGAARRLNRDIDPEGRDIDSEGRDNAIRVRPPLAETREKAAKSSNIKAAVDAVRGRGRDRRCGTHDMSAGDRDDIEAASADGESLSRRQWRAAVQKINGVYPASDDLLELEGGAGSDVWRARGGNAARACILKCHLCRGSMQQIK
jgi:hypothetical protein